MNTDENPINYSEIEVKNLNNILKSYLPEDAQIKTYKTHALTQPGENYGTIMFRIDVELQSNKNGASELHLIGKKPPTNKWIKTLFNTAVTFAREIAVYQTIIPVLTDFQCSQSVSHKLSCLPVYYGSQTSLNSNSPELDEKNAILLLENLSIKGFQVADRLKGFDSNTTKLILKNLAILHAIPISLKTLKPKLFQDKVQCHLKPWRLEDKAFMALNFLFIDDAIEKAKLNEKCVPLIPKVQETIGFSNEHYASYAAPNEPFATFIHNDFWVNNIMMKYNKNHEAIDVRLIDFQTAEYGSLGQDIIFFLYTSVQPNILTQHFDEFIGLYYQTFIDSLKDMQCATNRFSYELFLKEIKHSARIEFWHILHMLRFVFSPKGHNIDIARLVETKEINFVSAEHCQRIADVILDFDKRNWL